MGAFAGGYKLGPVDAELSRMVHQFQKSCAWIFGKVCLEVEEKASES